MGCLIDRLPDCLLLDYLVVWLIDLVSAKHRALTGVITLHSFALGTITIATFQTKNPLVLDVTIIQVVPPPMSAEQLKLRACVRQVVYGPPNHPNDLTALLTDNSLHFYKAVDSTQVCYYAPGSCALLLSLVVV